MAITIGDLMTLFFEFLTLILVTVLDLPIN